MTLEQIFIVAVVLIPLTLVAIGRLRIDVAALAIAALLGIAQFLGLGVLGKANSPAEAIKSISGFSQSVVITLFSLFIVTRCLDKTGVTRWIARHVLRLSGASETRLIFMFTTVTALLSLFMNNLAAGALLLPSAIDVSRRTGVHPSKLLIPVAYGSLLGGVATYFTTANIIASDLLTSASPPQTPLRILDFTPTGGLIAIAGIIFITLLGKRILPDRVPRPEQMIARRTGSELETVYRLGERLWEAKIPPGSPLDGKTIAEIGIGDQLGITVAALWHGRQAIFAPTSGQEVRTNDILMVIGREDRVIQLNQRGFKVGRDTRNGHVSTRGVSFIEVILAPHSGSEDHSIKELNFRANYGFTAVALLRDGRSYRTDVGDIKLKMGDAILMVGERSRLRGLHSHPDFIVLEPDISDQPVDQRQAALAAAIIVVAIAASILGAPVYLSMLTAAIVVFALGLLTAEEAYRSMEWQAIFLIAGMYSVSIAMVNTGLAALIGQGVVALVTPFGPLGLAAGAYLLTAALTQIMGGQVTLLVTGPIVISAALHLHVSPQAVAIAAAIGCSASFLTPLAHPVNILMIGPGNYTFGDFFHIGWGLTILCFIMLLIGMVLFWHL